MILWRNIKNIHFYHFDSDPRYVMCKSGVAFVRRCFLDEVGVWIAEWIPFSARAAHSVKSMFPMLSVYLLFELFPILALDRLYHFLSVLTFSSFFMK